MSSTDQTLRGHILEMVHQQRTLLVPMLVRDGVSTIQMYPSTITLNMHEYEYEYSENKCTRVRVRLLYNVLEYEYNYIRM